MNGRDRTAATGVGLVRDSRFRLLWLGEALASISEQLFIICLTLLVLDLTGPGASLGLVLAAASIPRAILLLPGGVLADRVDPARIVVATTWLRAGVLGALAGVILFGPPPILVIAGLAALLGALDAAYYPASLSLLPRVVAPAGLGRANSMVQAAESAGDLLGPILAAGLVAAVGLGGGLSVVTGLYLAAAVVLTALARRLLRHTPHPNAVPAGPGPERGPTTFAAQELHEGLRFAWGQPVVRIMLLVLAVLNIAVIGPILVGGAVLAEQRLGGSAALGVVFAGFGVGSLLGLLAAGTRTVTRRRGLVLLSAMALIGAGTAAFGAVTGVGSAVVVAAIIGVGSAYLGVVLVAWLQELVPERLRGRVMSLVVLAVVAFDPLSFALAGVLLPFGVLTMFVVAGAIVLLAAGLAALTPAVRSLS